MSAHQHITLSLSQELIREMHLFLKKGEMSKFVGEAVAERLKECKQSLEQQYMEAAKDQERNTLFREWDMLAGEGLDEQNDW